MSESEESEIAKLQAARKGGKVSLTSAGAGFDQDLYGGDDKSQYVTELPMDGDADDDLMDMDVDGDDTGKGKRALPASARHAALQRQLLAQGAARNDGADPMAEYRESRGSGLVNTRISDREGEYQKQRYSGKRRMLSPSRKGAGEGGRSYAEIMKEQALENERAALEQKIVSWSSAGVGRVLSLYRN